MYDAPLGNYSSEYDDGPNFGALAFPPWNPYDPGLPAWWAAEGCQGIICNSSVSQADAELCAQRISILCSFTVQMSFLGISSSSQCAQLLDAMILAQALGDTASYDIYRNAYIAQCIGDIGTQQPPYNPFYNDTVRFSVTCPDGVSSGEVVVVAGSFIARSQILADRLALQYAQSLARIAIGCPGNIARTACLGLPYDSTLTVGGRGAAYTIELVSGSLPAGLTFTQTGPKTAKISGTPTTGGSSTFSVKVTSPTGQSATRTYSICVISIVSTPAGSDANHLPDAPLGEAYNVVLSSGCTVPDVVWAITSGDLPDGLFLDLDTGNIFGTASEEGDYSFSVTVADESGDLCSKTFALRVSATGPDWASMAWLQNYPACGPSNPPTPPYHVPTGTFSGADFSFNANGGPQGTGMDCGVLPDAVSKWSWTGTLPYNGPAASCNLNLAGTTGPGNNLFDNNGFCDVTISQDGVDLYTWRLGPGLGGMPDGDYDLPFSINDTLGATQAITVRVDFQGGGPNPFPLEGFAIGTGSLANT